MYRSRPTIHESLVGAGRRFWVSLAGFLLFVPLALGCGCLTSADKKDECKATEETMIEPLFRIHFLISRMNGDPYTNLVKFRSEKHYCSGTLNGVFNDSSPTTQNGYWKPITTQYKLANENDFVRVNFSTNSFSEDFDFYYVSVRAGARLDEAFQLVFEDTIRVHLNW